MENMIKQFLRENIESKSARTTEKITQAIKKLMGDEFDHEAFFHAANELDRRNEICIIPQNLDIPGDEGYWKLI